MNHPYQTEGATGGNTIPDEEQIELLLRKIQPLPQDDFHRKMEEQPWNSSSHKQSLSRLQLKSMPAVLFPVLILVLIVSFFTPSLGALANRIALFFTPASKDQILIQVPAIDLNDPEMRFSLSIEEATSLIGFPVKVPISLPESYRFGGAAYNTARGIVTLNYKTASGCLLRISQGLVDIEYQRISIHADVEKVSIGSTIGEYVVGGWKAFQSDSTSPTSTTTANLQAIWEPDANIHFLRWQENDILYELFFSGVDPEVPDFLNKDDLIAIAEDMQ